MAVYPPSGSGGAHMDKSISGKKATQPAKITQGKKKSAKNTKNGGK